LPKKQGSTRFFEGRFNLKKPAGFLSKTSGFSGFLKTCLQGFLKRKT